MCITIQFRRGSGRSEAFPRGATARIARLSWRGAQGRSLEEASSIRQVTVNTARSQLKQVFAKTGTRRQSQLLQVVLSSVALVDQDDDEEAR